MFSFPNNSKKLFTLETRDNPKGLCQVNSLVMSERQLMVSLGHKIGSIQLVVLIFIVYQKVTYLFKNNYIL